MVLIESNIYAYLLHLVDSPDKRYLQDFVNHSEFYLSQRRIMVMGNFKSKYSLNILADPEIFKKYFGHIDAINHELKNLYTQITGVHLERANILPQLNKFQILNNTIVPVITPWDKINMLQDKLLSDLRAATETIDYQNIGNSARTIMLQLSSIVFNPSLHTADGVDLSEGKFKNRLHTVIKQKLSSNSEEEFLKYIRSIIETVEKAIDLSNKLTHDTNTNNLVAESCVIAVITVIALVKIIHKS